MNKMVMIGLAAAAMALTACGPKHLNEEYSKYDPSMSKAMNLALLTELTTKDGPLKDSKPVKVAKNTSNPLQTLNTASSVAMVAAQSTGAMLDVGMGIEGSMGAGALGILMGGNTDYKPVLSGHIFAWMPTSFAENETSATNKMATLLYSHIKDSLPKEVKYTRDIPPYPYKLFSEAKAFEITVELEGHKYSIEGNIAVPELTKKSWLTDGEKTYYWSYMRTSRDNSSTMGYSIYLLDGDKLKYTDDGKLDNLSILKKVASKLPSWVYVYVAPNIEKKTPAYFLNQGKVLPFIRPAMD